VIVLGPSRVSSRRRTHKSQCRVLRRYGAQRALSVPVWRYQCCRARSRRVYTVSGTDSDAPVTRARGRSRSTSRRAQCFRQRTDGTTDGGWVVDLYGHSPPRRTTAPRSPYVTVVKSLAQRFELGCHHDNGVSLAATTYTVSGTTTDVWVIRLRDVHPHAHPADSATSPTVHR